MSEKRTFFVSDPNNYLQREVVSYIGENFPGSKIRVSVASSEEKKKPIKHVTKILNRQKPKLFQSYLQRCQYLMVDLMFNQTAEEDVQMIVSAIQKMKEFPQKIKIVVFSSIMSWVGTESQTLYHVNKYLDDKTKKETQETG